MVALAGESLSAFGTAEVFGQEIQTILKHRDDVLHSFRVKNSHEIMQNPDMFFRTIVSEFQEQNALRRVWGRGYEVRPRRNEAAQVVAESSYVVYFGDAPSGQTYLWTRMLYQNNEPAAYEARTRLHYEENWEYVFYSSSRGIEVFQEGYERGQTRLFPADELSSITLLQALGVEMLSSITDMRQYKKKVQAVNHESALRRTHQLVHHTRL